MTEEAQAIVDKLLQFTPLLMRRQRADRLHSMLGLLMAARSVARADRALAIEAAKLVVDKGYDPLFHMWEDMAAYKRIVLDTYESKDAAHARRVLVKRWEKPPVEKPPKAPGQMKVLAFCASPRKNGNTDLLVQEAVRGAQDAGAQAELIRLQQTQIGFCIGCRKCKDPGYEGMCVVRDDMTAIYQKVIDADALIIGFPIYTGRECAQLSTFLDRWDCFERYQFQPSLKPGRRAMLIGAWGYPYDDTYDFVIQNIMVILKLHGIETVEALSACGFEGMTHGLDDNHCGVVARHPEQLHKAFEAGRGLVT